MPEDSKLKFTFSECSDTNPWSPEGMGSVMDNSEVEIPTHCKAGVVVNEGPNFHVEVQMVPVPEPGKTRSLAVHTFTATDGAL